MRTAQRRALQDDLPVPVEITGSGRYFVILTLAERAMLSELNRLRQQMTVLEAA